MYRSGLGAYLVGSGYNSDMGAYALGFGVAAEEPPEPPAGIVSASPRAAPFNRALREFPSAITREFPK